MSQTITNAFVQQWDSSLQAAAQQSVSRLRATVRDRGMITGESFTINLLGTVELGEDTVRHGDTEWDEILHSTRVVPMKDFFSALPLDRFDIPKMLINPVTGGDYMRELINGRNRKIDDIIYKAAISPVLLKDGSSVVLPSTQKIVGGGTGLTKAKIIQALSMFRANEVDAENGEELYLLYNDVALTQILSDTTLTNADFMAGQMLQQGKVAGSWLGFNWIPYQKFNATAGVYSTIAYSKNGIQFGTGFEEGLVARRPDKKDLWQVSMKASYGAGRADEKKVVQIDFV